MSYLLGSALVRTMLPWYGISSQLPVSPGDGKYGSVGGSLALSRIQESGLTPTTLKIARRAVLVDCRSGGWSARRNALADATPAAVNHSSTRYLMGPAEMILADKNCAAGSSGERTSRNCC